MFKKYICLAMVVLIAGNVLHSGPVLAYYASMLPEEEQRREELPEYSIYRLLKIAMQPMGKTMYIWGGGWNEEDTAAGVEAVSVGISPKWEGYCQLQNAAYDFNQTRYQIHNGLDCSGYVGWVIYNLLHTENGTEEDGYVMKAKKMAKAFSQKGWGEYTPPAGVKDHKAGDILSSKTHVYFVIGSCEDGSIVLAHASPPGVQINGTVDAKGNKKSQAAALADQYMRKYYPAWYARYKPEVRDFSYLRSYGRMRWNTADDFWMKDSEGLRNMGAKDVLMYLFGEWENNESQSGA